MAKAIESAETSALPIEAILRTHLQSQRLAAKRAQSALGLVPLSGIGWPDLPVRILDQDNQKKSRRVVGSRCPDPNHRAIYQCTRIHSTPGVMSTCFSART